MNSTPRPPIATNSRGHPLEFEQLIREKSENFVGREFVFTALNQFLHECNSGYFTLIGAPGSGKSAILAQYVTENPQVVYYNAQVEGKNQADQFLTTVCTQLLGSWDVAIPDNATEGSWFLSLLLQKISDKLEPDQRLIIALDALDAIDRNSQSPDSNLFYLPRYLPEKVYFLLTRRPFLREKSGLLIETPYQILDLGDYPEQNREDVQTYIRQYLPLPHNSSEQEFSVSLTRVSENNFMYLSQTLLAISESGRSVASIAQGFRTKRFLFYRLPPGLKAYYQSHWQHLIDKPHFGVAAPHSVPTEDFSKVELGVLSLLARQEQPISVEDLAKMLDEDEYEVQEIIENWIEFLQQQEIGGETCYRLYHSSFRHWLFFKTSV